MAAGKPVDAALTSRRIVHSKRARLHFTKARFAIGQVVRRARRLPARVALSTRGLKSGLRTLTVRVYYRHARRGHKRRVTVSKRLRVKFRVC